MACSMASRSCGVAPRALRARTTSANWGEAGTWIRMPGSCLIWMLERSATTVWPPVDKGLGWLITGVVLMVTDRLPCAMALGPSVTAWFITMEPVRALITTLAEGMEFSMLNSSISAIKLTRAFGSVGARTWIVRPSAAWAVPSPKRRLMACATLRAVWKSDASNPRLMLSPSCNGVATARSTWAPLGMRPALRWLICTLLPPAAAPAPATIRLPWASA